jgi:putative PIN family toxin of toxin-antitoxin system
MKFVLDTNILVAALRSKSGCSRRWLDAALRGRVSMLVSVPLMLEYEDVLKRPEHLLATRMRTEDVNQFLDGLSGIVEPVCVSYLWRPRLSDPADEMVLEAAANGSADWIVTYNVRDHAGIPESFRIAVGAPAPVWQHLFETSEHAQK